MMLSLLAGRLACAVLALTSIVFGNVMVCVPVFQCHGLRLALLPASELCKLGVHFIVKLIISDLPVRIQNLLQARMGQSSIQLISEHGST